MKKYICIVMILLAGGLAFAIPSTESLNGLLPKNPRAMGMGGAFRVFSTGYDTFFGNPAGFASKNGSLTFADIATWAYFKPTVANIDKVQALLDGVATTGETVSYVSDWVINNGLGVGVSAGLGWAGKGFGLGFNLVTDNVASGTSLLSSTLTSATQGNVVAGLGLPINLGPVKIKLGADARAFYILDSYSGSGNNWPFSTILASMAGGGDPMTAIESMSVIGGYGFAVDAGLTIGLGPFMLGAMVRDYGFEFGMGTDTVGNVLNTTMVPVDGTLPHILTPTVSVGAGLAFDFGIIAPSLYVEAEDPLSLIDAGIDGIWNKVHAGAELELLQFIKLRAGLNKGWVSVGAGLDLIIFEFDAALFTEEMGANPGDFGRTGLAIQAAFRF